MCVRARVLVHCIAEMTTQQLSSGQSAERLYSIKRQFRAGGYLIRSRQDYIKIAEQLKDDLPHSLGQHKEKQLSLSGLLA